MLPVLAFVALAAIGLIAAGMNSGPRYEAFLNVPGEPAYAQSQESQQDQADAGAQGDDQAADANQDDADAAQDDNVAISPADPEDGQTKIVTDDGTVEIVRAAPALDLSAIPSDDAVSTFSASDGANPAVSEASLQSVGDAFAQLTEGGVDAGFVFMNLSTGAGIAANADQKVYGASSIKGPFVTYICEELVDGDEITLDTSCLSMTESFQSNGKANVGSLIENTVTQSLNGSFAGLRKTYGGSDYAAWLTSLDVDPDIHENGDWYAWYTARDAAKLWTEVYGYLESGSETAEWLEGLMEGTNVSYIRDGASTLKTQLQEQEWQMPPMQASPTKLIKTTADSVTGYQRLTTLLDEVTVANKAGWCVSDSGSSIDYDSTSDNGIVTIDGQDYLLCIMTGAPYNDRNAGKVTNLAAQLIATYGELSA